MGNGVVCDMGGDQMRVLRSTGLRPGQRQAYPRRIRRVGLVDVLSHVFKPFFPGYPGLAQDPHKKVRAYFSPVRVRDCEDKIAFDHIRMFPPLERAIKSKCFQPVDQFLPGNGRQFMR